MKSPAFRKVIIFPALALVIIGVGSAWFYLSSVSTRKIRNVLLISIDTCRADYLSCYGYPRKTTPNLDNVAQEGIFFTNVTSPVPMTLPGHCSMLTGTIPPYHQVHDNYGAQLGPSKVTLAEIMQDRGYRTAAIIGNYVLDSKFGLDQGFDIYIDEYEAREDDLDNGRIADETNRLAFDWLAEQGKERFFLFLHYFDPHLPYEPPEPFASAYSDNAYAGEIVYTDECIGQLITKLKDLGLYESTLLIVTSDHGEMLGEHGESEHGYFIYESAIKVPLILRVPEGLRGRKINIPASLIDIVPTICSILGIPVPSHIQGRDLSAYFGSTAVTAGESQDYVYCESFLPAQYGCNPLLGLLDENWKYIQTSRPELYDLVKDPGERINMVEEKPKRARLMLEHLKLMLEEQSYKGVDDSVLKVDAETIRRLESLGYIAGGMAEKSYKFDQSKADPKDWIALHEQRKKFNILVTRKQYKQAKLIGDKILAEDPQDVHLCYKMAVIATILGNPHDAQKYYTQVLEHDPQWSEAHLGLADILLKNGHLLEAIGHYERALELMPDWDQARDKLRLAKARKTHIEKTIASWEESLRKEPNQPKVHGNLGTIYYRQRDAEKAVYHWQMALRLDPDQPGVLNNLAWIKIAHEDPRFRDPQKALQMARRACELVDYKQPQFLGTLAAAYAATGDFAAAAESAEQALKLAQATGNKSLIAELQKRLELYKRK